MFGLLSHYFTARGRSEDLSGHFRKGLERIRNRAERSKRSVELSPARQLVLDSVRRAIRLRRWHASQRACPECSRSLIVIDVRGTAVDHCRACGSFWFDSGELREMTRLGADVPGLPLTHRESSMRCPICGRRMLEFQFARGSNLMVDRCNSGHGVYLQDQELSRALRNADWLRPSRL